MINKIVKLESGSICRIIDKIYDNGSTIYLAIEFDKCVITRITPKQIVDILTIDKISLVRTNEFISIKDRTMTYGL